MFRYLFIRVKKSPRDFSLQAWVQFGLPLDSCDPIVDRLLACVADEELQDTVMEALSSLISHPDTHKYPANLMEVLKNPDNYDEFRYSLFLDYYVGIV